MSFWLNPLAAGAGIHLSNTLPSMETFDGYGVGMHDNLAVVLCRVISSSTPYPLSPTSLRSPTSERAWSVRGEENLELAWFVVEESDTSYGAGAVEDGL